MGNNFKRKSLSLLLCLIFCLNLLPGAALAAPGEAKRDGEAALAATQENVKVESKVVPAKALAEDGKTVIDTTVKEYTFTFDAPPANAKELRQYQLDSPYKTMALLILAFRTWTPEDPSVCLEMLDYLTDTRAALSDTGESCPFSRYTPWVNALADRMTQNDKFRFIGNAYLGGATPENNYTPNDPITVTVRQSVYDPYKAATETTPALKQVLISLAGSENDRYSLFFQDDSGNWKVWGANWSNLLADVQTAEEDILYPPEYQRPAESDQKEPAVTVKSIPAKAAGVDENGDPIVIDTTVEEYTFTFSTVPKNYEEIIQYKLDSPYKTMALLFLAFRTWTPDNPTDCEQMLDYLTNTAMDSKTTDAQGHKISTKFSEYPQWTQFLKDRMKQNDKYRFIGNAYLGGASPENDYIPDTPVTVTVRQSTYDPYKASYQGITGKVPDIKQVLIDIEGADNSRYSLLYQDQRGDWRIWGDNWKGLLADVQTPYCDILWPPEYTIPANPANPQTEPKETVMEIPAKAPAVDDDGNPIVIDVTVKQHTFTFSTIPTCYEDIVQYKLDSPYKTMALMILAFRTWTPENKKDCTEMMNYLTNTNVDSYKTDAAGRKLSKNFSDHQHWTDFLRDRMTQPTTGPKYRFIGNAYLGGAMPANDYTPSEPVTITVRESVYNPFKGESSTKITDADPPIYQVLISLPGADNDRYSLFYQDQRGDWRVFGDNWKGLLTDIKTPSGDIPWPAEVTRSEKPAHVQQEPTVEETNVPAKAAGVDEHGDPIVIDTTVKEYTYTFSTIPTCYEDIVQYKLDSPYKTMALLFLAFRTWTPENQENCAKMLEYLTNTAVEKPGATDAAGHKLSYGFSEYNPWIQALRDRMLQNDKYQYIGNAYLNGATPANSYTPSSPVKITVRQSTYDPFKAASDTNPELKQVLIKIPGADNDRYSLFYQDQRGDWRVFGDNWQGLLADVKEPGGKTQVSIGNALRAGDVVAFTVYQDDSGSVPLVASYDEDGKMIALERAVSLGKEGDLESFEADVVDQDGASFKILLPEAGSFEPLCGAQVLK